MKIVVINGYPCSGKTTFIQQLQKRYFHIKNFSSIDYVKDFMGTYLRWNGRKDPESRKLMSVLKDALEDYDNSITKDLFRKIEKERYKEFFENNYNEEKDFGETIIFVDIREPRRINEFVNNCIGYFGITPITVFINREDVKNKVQSNESDKNVEDYGYDYYIDNDGTVEKLYFNAVNFCKNITNID